MKKTNDSVIEQAYQLRQNGKTWLEIGTELNVKPDTISKHVRKRFNLPKENFEKKINQEDFENYWNQGLTDEEIAIKFGVTINTIRSFRTKGENAGKFNTKRYFSQEEAQLSYEQKQFILGSLLGDLSLRPSSKKGNCRLYLVQSIKQEAFFLKKVNMLGTFMGSYRLTNLNPDKRTGVAYPTYRGNSKTHPIFNEIYALLYKNKVKQITVEFLNEITHPIALAYWFMDDGCNDGTLATNGFSYDEVILLQEWLYNKWNISCTIHKNKNHFQLYILSKSRFKFEQLIFPYMIPEMYYKLKYANSLKTSV